MYTYFHMPQRLNWQNMLIGLLLVGIFTLGFVISYLSLKLSGIFVPKPTATPNIFAAATAKPIEQTNKQVGTYNILLLGYGGAGHAGSLLTDSMIIVHIDTTSKKVTFVSVPRDLWIPGNRKVNAEGSLNGFNNVGSTITSITGLPINYFVSVDFGGFTKIIDDLGGVTAQVPATFDDPFYPITGQENNTCGLNNDQIEVLKTKYTGYNLETQFTCRYEHLHFDKGPVSLDGTTALKFVRSRHGDSDFGRTARQFAVLQGIEAKLISFQAAKKFDDIVNTISNIVKTDLDAGTIKSLVGVLGDPKAYTFNQIELTTDNVLNSSTSNDGQFILVPKTGNFDFSGIQSYLKSSI